MSDQMPANRCAAHCQGGCNHDRRKFLQGSAALLLGSALGSGLAWAESPAAALQPIRPCGPASKHTPVVKAAFVRRQGEYGMRWPGAIYDGEAARAKYTNQITATAQRIGIQLELRPEPIYSGAEADAWLGETKGADGLLVLLLDRQDHAWPTAAKAAATGIPTVIFSPLGSSFTTNTTPLADTPGCVIVSTDDPRQLDFGLKMLWAGAKMRRTRCIVIKGNKRTTQTMPDLGIELQTIPAQTFLDDYNAMATSAEIESLAADFLKRARGLRGATRQDVLNGVKSYFVARQILEREGGDAITMDCLGALGKTKVSLPCIAWSRMNDEGIPAACEADTGAVAAHVMVQYLFDRPGFQQDPVADTADDTIIGAHCSCATRLKGFGEAPEPFDLIHHHGNRDAVPRTLWPAGQRVTCLDVLPADPEQQTPAEVLVSVGSVVANIDAPPAGGCVVSVKIKLDGERKVLAFPGFHQLFYFGDTMREMKMFCQLAKLNIKAV